MLLKIQSRLDNRLVRYDLLSLPGIPDQVNISDLEWFAHQLRERVGGQAEPIGLHLQHIEVTRGSLRAVLGWSAKTGLAATAGGIPDALNMAERVDSTTIETILGGLATTTAVLIADWAWGAWSSQRRGSAAPMPAPLIEHRGDLVSKAQGILSASLDRGCIPSFSGHFEEQAKGVKFFFHLMGGSCPALSGWVRVDWDGLGHQVSLRG